MKIGVISDTHGFLDPKIFQLFSGVGHILHAGDIGYSSIILELGEIAPVTAVRGNTDMDLPFKETETVELSGRKFLVHHIINPYEPAERVSGRIRREKPNVVVFGHTHRSSCETVGDILFLNPGYSGKPKYGTGRSVAILHCDEKEVRTEFLAL
jgi:putative phosphoesterase